ncbi:MAG: transposase [Planctomycetes bacterium]|nr:transposase [Planctomycetota bacterium]
MQEFSRHAAFRFQVVSQVLSRTLAGETQREAVLKVAGLQHYFPGDAHPRRVSERAIYRWLDAYRRRGFEGLETSGRPVSAGPGSVLPPKFRDYLVTEKGKDARASLPEIIRRAVKRGILRHDEPVDRTTVYRTAQWLGLEVARRKRKPSGGDARRFAYAHRMEMVLCDGVHFRAGATRARRVAMFFLDDATRNGLHVVVGTSENAALFQRGVFELVGKVGYFSIIYLDRGPGFIAEDTVTVIRNLHSLLIYGERAYPAGHGKIERFNESARAAVLRGLDRRPDVDPECGSLELRLRHYLDNQYNHLPHEGIGKEAPYERFSRDPRELRFPESIEDLRRLFEVYLTRRVSPDNIVSIDSVPYEVPGGHDGAIVTLRRKLLAGGGILLLHEGRLVELHPVDLEANARARRGRPAQSTGEVEHPLPPSAADLGFQRDYGSVLGPDGGCPDPQPPPNPQEQP